MPAWTLSKHTTISNVNALLEQDGNGPYVAKYGFYMHVFSKPDAVVHQLQSLRRL